MLPTRSVSVDSLDDTTRIKYEQKGSKWFVNYFYFLERRGKFILIGWLLM